MISPAFCQLQICRENLGHQYPDNHQTQNHPEKEPFFSPVLSHYYSHLLFNRNSLCFMLLGAPKPSGEGGGSMRYACS
jgi:hypothetical protein